MNTLKRLTTTLIATVDRTVASMEDHEAVVAAAIRESRKVTARARFKLNRLRAENQRLTNRIDALQVEADKWQQRAISLNEVSREDAVNCIAHRRRCADRIESLTVQLEQQKKLELQSIKTVERLSDKVDVLNSKRAQLATRAASAEAMDVMHRLEGDDGLEIDDMLDRWEESVFETEAHTGSGFDASHGYTSADDLPERLANEEQQLDLQRELDALLTTTVTETEGETTKPAVHRGAS